MPDMNPKADVLIVTVTKEESQAVMKAFQEATGEAPKSIHIGGRVYHNLSEVNGTRVFMALSEMGAGGPGASQQTVQKGIAALRPSAVIMVGIAFGINEQKQAIGDILVSHQLWLYELQRIGTDKIISRGNKITASPRLINYLRGADLYWSGAKVHFGLILTGEKLIDNIDYRDQLKQFEPEVIGGEMEGAGLYVACDEAHVDWILVKAICDWADGNKALDKSARQELAAKNAAHFLLYALKGTPLVRKPWQKRLITIAVILIMVMIVIMSVAIRAGLQDRANNIAIQPSSAGLTTIPTDTLSPTIAESTSVPSSQPVEPTIITTDTPSPTSVESTLVPPPSATSVPAATFTVTLAKILRSDPPGEVWGVAFSPDNTTVANTNYDGIVRRWSIKSGKELDRFGDKGDGPFGLNIESKRPAIGIAYSPDGTIIAATYQDGSVKLWQISDGALLHNLKGHTSAAWAVAWSYDGKILASAGVDGTIRLWDTNNGEDLQIIRGSANLITNVAFSPDGTLIAYVSTGILYIWDIENENKKLEIDSQAAGAMGLSWSSDGKYIAYGGIGGKVSLWQADNGELIHTFELEDGIVSVAFSGDIVAVGCADKKIWFLNAKTNEVLRSVEGAPDVITSLAWSPNGQYLISSSQDGTLIVWEVSR